MDSATSTVALSPYTLEKPKELYKKAFLLGLLLSALMFLPYVIKDGGLFFFYGDYDVQQIPFYKLAHEAIRSGNLGWNWNTDLGANFMSSYSFYLLGSPFFWLTIPFPTSFVPYLMAPLFCLKFATATLTAYAYLSRFVKNKNLAVLGGILYAFSGYGIYNIFFNHFHECIAFFPLLLLGLELYMKDGKRGVFFFAVFLNAMVNYIFFFGEVVFILIYFIARMSTGDFKLTIKKFLTLAFESIFGFLMASWILLPAIMGVISNPRLSNILTGWSAITYDNVQKYLYILQSFFFPPELPARPNFFPDSNAKWSSVAAWLPLVGMSGAIAFIQSTKKNFIRRILGVCALFALVPILNSSFVMFNTSYYARWFYMPILFLCLATIISLENDSIDLKQGWRWNAGIVIGFIIAIGLTPTISGGKIEKIGLYSDGIRFWVYAALAVVSLGILFVLYRMDRKNKEFLSQLTLSICCIAISTGIIFIGMGKNLGYGSTYIKDSGFAAWENWSLPDDPDSTNDYYRVDVYDGMDNIAMFWNMSTIQAFQSVVPGSIMDFYPSIGVDRGVGSRPDIKYRGLRDLVSIKYTMAKAGSEFNSPGFSYYNTQFGFDIYINENFIPMGFTYDSYMNQEQFDTVPIDNKDAAFVKAILLDTEQIEKYSSILTQADNQILYNISYDILRDEATARKNGSVCDTFIISNRGFDATITLPKDNLVFFSVPYEEGWSATVDGVNVPIEKVNVGFMAVEVPSGSHSITFTYKTPGATVGLIISGLSLLIFIAYIYFFVRKDWTKKQKKFEVEDLLLEKIEVKDDAEPENAIDYFTLMEERLGIETGTTLELDSAFTNNSSIADFGEKTDELPLLFSTDPETLVENSLEKNHFYRANSAETDDFEKIDKISEPKMDETREIKIESIDPEEFAVRHPQLEYIPNDESENESFQDAMADIQSNLEELQKKTVENLKDKNKNE